MVRVDVVKWSSAIAWAQSRHAAAQASDRRRV
jgi:hypothetical protein